MLHTKIEKHTNFYVHTYNFLHKTLNTFLKKLCMQGLNHRQTGCKTENGENAVNAATCIYKLTFFLCAINLLQKKALNWT